MSDDAGGEIIIEDAALAGGFVQVPAAVYFDPRLKDGAVRVYGALLWYAWKDGRFPGQEAMARELGGGARTVRRHLAELEEAGYLEARVLGLGRPNQYVVKSLGKVRVPDRPKLAGLGGQNWPVNPAKIGRSHRVVDSEVKAHSEQQQAARPAKRGRQTAQAAPDPGGGVVVEPASLSTADDHDDTAQLTADLVAFGVAKTTARKIASEHDPDAVRGYLRHMERLKAGGAKPKVSWAALLVAAIREGYVLPEEPTQAEGQRALLIAEERPLTAEEQAAGLAELEAFRAARQRGT